MVSKALHATRVEGLDLLVELAPSTDISKLDIITLNHDTLIEQILTENNTPFVDGFGPIDGDFRLYDNKLYDADDAKVRLFKPHGSVNWYNVRNMTYPAIFCGNDIRDGRLSNGDQRMIDTKTPSFLSGANKVVSYNRGIYSEMFFRFHQVLREH
jgi:hypothetical protein